MIGDTSVLRWNKSTLKLYLCKRLGRPLMKDEKNKVSSLFKPPVVYKDSLRDQYSKMLKDQAESNLLYQRIVEESRLKGMMEW